MARDKEKTCVNWQQHTQVDAEQKIKKWNCEQLNFQE